MEPPEDGATAEELAPPELLLAPGTRGPQSVQSVPRLHTGKSEPGPPSSHTPSFCKKHVSVHNVAAPELEPPPPEDAPAPEDTTPPDEDAAAVLEPIAMDDPKDAPPDVLPPEEDPPNEDPSPEDAATELLLPGSPPDEPVPSPTSMGTTHPPRTVPNTPARPTRTTRIGQPFARRARCGAQDPPYWPAAPKTIT